MQFSLQLPGDLGPTCRITTGKRLRPKSACAVVKAGIWQEHQNVIPFNCGNCPMDFGALIKS